MAVGIAMAAAVAMFIVAVIWYGARGERNEDPARGSNSPYPSTLSGDDPPYLPTPIISENEEFRREAGARLARLRRRRNRRDAGRGGA